MVNYLYPPPLFLSMEKNDYAKEFTGARLELLPPEYTEITIWYDEENDIGDLLDSDYEPKVIELMSGRGKNKVWRLLGTQRTFGNKDLAEYLRKELIRWQDSEPNRYATIDFRTKDDDIEYIDDIFAKGSITRNRFSDGHLNPTPKMYKGFKTATYGRKKHRNNITQLENSVRRMF